MEIRLHGRTAPITGGSKGLGLAMATPWNGNDLRFRKSAPLRRRIPVPAFGF